MTTPIVRYESLQLFELAHIGGQQGMFDFVQNIYWVRSADARVVIMHGGQVITTDATFCDVGDYLSCVRFAVAHACMLINTFQVNETSTLNVSVLLSIMDTPMVATLQLAQPELATHKQLKEIQNNWYFPCTPDPHSASVQRRKGYELLATKTVARDEPVFESLSYFDRFHTTPGNSLLSAIEQSGLLIEKTQPHFNAVAAASAAAFNSTGKGV